LFLKGREAEAEIAAARGQWEFTFCLYPSLTSKEAQIVEVTGLRPRAEAAVP
jgi:16S rRNA (guanine527-N7)-methyltransferase